MIFSAVKINIDISHYHIYCIIIIHLYGLKQDVVTTHRYRLLTIKIDNIFDEQLAEHVIVIIMKQ